MRLTDCDNVIDKGNVFQYCFDRVDGIPLKDVIYVAGGTSRNKGNFAASNSMSTYFVYDRIRHIIGIHKKRIRVYVFRDRNCYGKIMQRYNKNFCVRFDVSNIEYDFDTNNGLLMVNGNLPKNISAESFIVGDLRIGNYEFIIDCVSSEHFYHECFYFGDDYEY